jgi:RNA polymerase sigma-70 factor (ECF subfamily)
MFSDQEIVKMTIKGKKDSFNELVMRHSSKVYSLCLRMLKDPLEAEDVTQETFLRAYRALDTYNSNYSFRNWLLKIASNLCIDRVRQRKGISFTDTDDELINYTQSLFVSPEKAIIDNENIEKLTEALYTLPVRYQLVLLLRYLEGLKYEEIANVLEEPLGTIKTQLHRARKLLKERYFND